MPRQLSTFRPAISSRSQSWFSRSTRRSMTNDMSGSVSFWSEMSEIVSSASMNLASNHLVELIRGSVDSMMIRKPQASVFQFRPSCVNLKFGFPVQRQWTVRRRWFGIWVWKFEFFSPKFSPFSLFCSASSCRRSSPVRFLVAICFVALMIKGLSIQLRFSFLNASIAMPTFVSKQWGSILSISTPPLSTMKDMPSRNFSYLIRETLYASVITQSLSSWA